jgi:hypothetical protein
MKKLCFVTNLIALVVVVSVAVIAFKGINSLNDQLEQCYNEDICPLTYDPNKEKTGP